MLILVSGCGGGEGNDSGASSESDDVVESTSGSGESSSSVLSGKYLLAFHTWDTASGEPNTPQNHVTYIAQSDDGVTWSEVSGYEADHGSVPDLIRRGDVLYLYRGGSVVRYHLDTDEWEDPLQISTTDDNGDFVFTTDLTPIVDEEGRITIFYLRGDVHALSEAGEGTLIIGSATEVEGSDGAIFLEDAGSRAEIEYANSKLYTDPDIFRGPDGYVLYVSFGTNVLAYRSSSIRGRFDAASELSGGRLVQGLGGVPSGHYDDESGEYWTYIHTPQDDGTVVIRRAVHATLETELEDSNFEEVLSGTSFPGLGETYAVESRGFTVNEP